MCVIFGKPSIDFMKWRYYSFALAMVCTGLGLLAMIQIGRGAANLGIDFAGGTAVQLRVEQPVAIEAALETFHDVMAVLGIFYLLDKEITLLLVTARLTLAGYFSDRYDRRV